MGLFKRRVSTPPTSGENEEWHYRRFFQAFLDRCIYLINTAPLGIQRFGDVSTEPGRLLRLLDAVSAGPPVSLPVALGDLTMDLYYYDSEVTFDLKVRREMRERDWQRLEEKATQQQQSLHDLQEEVAALRLKVRSLRHELAQCQKEAEESTAVISRLQGEVAVREEFIREQKTAIARLAEEAERPRGPRR